MDKRLFRFRISSLLVVTTFVAAGLGWYINRVMRQPDYKIMELGGSLAMAPTITREYLAVDVHAYRLVKPARWEVVVLDPQEQPTGAYIAKVLRVIGLPGGRVPISGHLAVSQDQSERFGQIMKENGILFWTGIGGLCQVPFSEQLVESRKSS